MIVGDLNSRFSVLNGYNECDNVHEQISDFISPICNYTEDDGLSDRVISLYKIFIHSDHCSLHQTNSRQWICHNVTKHLLTQHVVNVYSTISSVSSMHLSCVGLNRLLMCRKISKYFDFI